MCVYMDYIHIHIYIYLSVRFLGYCGCSMGDSRGFRPSTWMMVCLSVVPIVLLRCGIGGGVFLIDLVVVFVIVVRFSQGLCRSPYDGAGQATWAVCSTA